MKKALMIGGGFAGCTTAHQLAIVGGWDVTIVEASNVLGDGVRTNYYGGHPYTFGPRHFLTRKPETFEFLNKYCPLRRCQEHEFWTYVERDGQFYNYPINTGDIDRMPDKDKVHQQLKEAKGVEGATNLEDFWIGSVGEILYDKMVHKYTEKMWRMKSCKELDTFNWSPKGVTIKSGPRACWDTAISAFPTAPDGYNKYFDIATADAKVLYNTRISHYDIPNKTVVINGEKQKFDMIVSTISADLLFDQCWGELPYVGRDFHKIVLPMEHCFPENVYFLYYANDEAFTRIVEYKKFYKHKSPTTLIGLEIPSLKGRYYPIPIKAEQAKAKKYFDMLPDGVFSIGRCGTYSYEVDVDDLIYQAMQIAKWASGKGSYPGAVPDWGK